MRLDDAAFRQRPVEAARKERRLDAMRGKATYEIHRIALKAAAVLQCVTGDSDFQGF